MAAATGSTVRGKKGCIFWKVLDWTKSYGDGVRHNRSGSAFLDLMTPGCQAAPGVFCF